MILFYFSTTPNKKIIPWVLFEEAKEAHRYSKLFGSDNIQPVWFDSVEEANYYANHEKCVFARTYLTQ